MSLFSCPRYETVTAFELTKNIEQLKPNQKVQLEPEKHDFCAKCAKITVQRAVN